MNNSTINEFISEMNLMASEGKPFLFIIDYEVNTGKILPLEACAENGIFYDIEGDSNFSYIDKKSKKILFIANCFFESQKYNKLSIFQTFS